VDGLVEWMRSSLQADASATSDPSVRIVAEDEGLIVGFVSARIYGPSDDARYLIMREASERVLHVDSLMVTARARRSGIARRLMDEVERWGRTHGAERLVVISSTAGEASMRFYGEALGLPRRSVS
jgi:predicted GNAT superfamily acetyltransferase